MEFELREYIAPLRKWWWLIVVATLLAGLSSYLATRQQVAVYRSTTTLMIGNTIDDPNPTNAQFSTSRQLASTYVDIAKRASVRNAPAEALGLPRVTQEIIVRQLNDTNLIDVIVTDTDPRRAQAVAEELVRQLVLRSPAGQEEEDQTFVNDLLKKYELQITETQEQITVKQRELGQAIGALEIAEIQDEISQMKSALSTLSTDYANLRSSTQQGATNTIRVIEQASLPQAPVEPNNLITILTAAGIGFVLSASAAYLLEYLDDTVRTPEALARLVQLPTLAGIPEAKLQNSEKLVTITQPRSPSSEAFRGLRTAIQFASVDDVNQVLLVTSATPNAGKSTTSSNLAVVLAQAGQRVLLIDTDLRRPSIHGIFGLPNKRGLTNLLLEFQEDGDEAATTNLVERTVQGMQVKGLQILTCGPLPPNPSELLGSKKMRQLISVLKLRYDFIVLDSPPALSVTDAVVLSTLVNGTLLVARSGQTRKDLIRQAVTRLREVNARLIGCVFNSLEVRNGSYGMYYYQDPYHEFEDDAVSEGKKKGTINQFLKRIISRQTS